MFPFSKPHNQNSQVSSSSAPVIGPVAQTLAVEKESTMTLWDAIQLLGLSMDLLALVQFSFRNEGSALSGNIGTGQFYSANSGENITLLYDLNRDEESALSGGIGSGRSQSGRDTAGKQTYSGMKFIA